MKKTFICLIAFIILCVGGYFIYLKTNKIPRIDVEEEKAEVDKFFIYGNHLNFSGSLNIDSVNYDDIKLVLYNGEYKEFNINSEKEGTKIIFNTSDYINEGMFIDNLERSTYYLFLRLEFKNEEKEDEPIYKYFVLDNKTDYDELIYYSLSKYNNKIIISKDDDYGSFMFDVIENNDKDIYDITIDPGHGGLDSGALAGKYKESDFTMDISKKIKSFLESEGIKVMLTHDSGDIPNDKTMDEYNEHGRAVIPNEVKSKYTFSIHINKNTYKGVKGIEVYTSDLIDTTFAKNIAESLISKTDFGYSSNKLYKVADGVYTHNFTESEISSSLKGYKDKGYKAYNITTKSNYLYMIRETGGIMTGAYVDNSNPDKVGVNPYYDSNMGNESYLLEVGYMSNEGDLDILFKSKDEIAKAISDSILEEVKITS